MPFEILCANLISGISLPDVAHDAAAVTPTVSVQNEDRKGSELR